MAVESFLTPSEVAEYRKRGFVIPRFRFSDEDVARLGTDASAIIDAYPGSVSDPILRTHQADAADRHPSLMPFCVRPEILDMVESLQGPDLMLWNATIFHRVAAEGRFTPWHQDGASWPIEPLATTSVWVAVSDCRPQTGCLRVIPGSHKARGAHVEDELGGGFTKALSPTAFDEADAVDVVLEPGQMLIFDAELIHGSHPNTSGQDRTGLVMRYCPTSCFFDHDGGDFDPDGKLRYTDQALFVVRGVNRCPRNDLQRNHHRSMAPAAP